MPGSAEITALYRALTADRPLGARMRVLPLHSTLSPSEQRRVFERPPPPLRKVVISTNVAETSITIDDITMVIDSGRVKENRYDAANHLPQLVDTWISRANRRQRRGRAGRVSPGEFFGMYTSETAEGMAPFQPAEMARVPLHELCLQIKLLAVSEVEAGQRQLLRAKQDRLMLCNYGFSKPSHREGIVLQQRQAQGQGCALSRWRGLR